MAVHKLRTHLKNEVLRMKISDLRYTTKMSQRKFAEHFGIPVGTLRNWEQGIASPPDYVLRMIYLSMRRDKMINIETIKFVCMMEDLARLSKNGIASFDEANEENFRTQIFYDPRTIDGETGYKVVLDACILDDPQCIHHDIIAYWDSDSLEYQIRVVFEEENLPYINVKLLISEEEIVIEDGSWYFA
jgi:transcriptional regulator with XRE-family HTH domain